MQLQYRIMKARLFDCFVFYVSFLSTWFTPYETLNVFCLPVVSEYR